MRATMSDSHLKAPTRPKSTEEIAADERSRVAREQYADREFKKPGWSKWRVYSWIVYRDPRLICKIEDQHGLRALALYSETPSPVETLLQALQDGRLKALGRQGKEIPVDFWLCKTARDVRDEVFRRRDVFAVWPPDPTAGLSLPDAGGVRKGAGASSRGPNNRARPLAAPADVRRWYELHVQGHKDSGTATSGENDWAAAKLNFGDRVRQIDIRALRRELTPPDWREPGRRSRKSGQK
jgi:hypothetical protein